MRLLVTRPDGTKEEVEVSLPITFEEVPVLKFDPYKRPGVPGDDSMGRMAQAFEDIATALTLVATLMDQRFQKDFPAKREPRDATVTRVPDADDALRRKQGASEEPTEEWIGLREQEFVESGKKG